MPDTPRETYSTSNARWACPRCIHGERYEHAEWCERRTLTGALDNAVPLDFVKLSFKEIEARLWGWSEMFRERR